MNKKGIQLSASHHAQIRLKERLGIEGKTQVKETIQQAYKKGISFKRHYIPKRTLQFIDGKLKKYCGRVSINHWRIYQDHLFLFSKTQTLITVYKLPDYVKMEFATEREFKA